MAEKHDPVEIPISKSYPSGVLLSDITQGTVDILDRLTRAIVSIQAALEEDEEALLILSRFRQSRWAYLLVLHSFEDISALCIEIASQVASLPPSSTPSDVKRTLDAVSDKIEIVLDICPWQTERVRKLERFWKRRVMPSLSEMARAPRPKPPELKKSSLLRRLCSCLLCFGAHQRPDGKDQTLPPYDFASSALHFHEDLLSLIAQCDQLTDYWYKWGMGPIEHVDHPKTDVHDAPWLEREWSVLGNLEKTNEDVRLRYRAVCNAAPSIGYCSL